MFLHIPESLLRVLPFKHGGDSLEAFASSFLGNTNIIAVSSLTQDDHLYIISHHLYHWCNSGGSRGSSCKILYTSTKCGQILCKPAGRYNIPFIRFNRKQSFTNHTQIALTYDYRVATIFRM